MAVSSYINAKIQAISTGGTSLGIELGSTRIKAVLIDGGGEILAVGSHDWENRLEGKIWTYSLDDIWNGIGAAYSSLKSEVMRVYGEELTKIGALGVSAMMHGYLAFDCTDNLLVPFRTWRNTTTEQAAQLLSERLDFNIPQRWSIAHLYQAVLNQEEHLPKIAFVTTLAGYVHYKLTGEKVLGVGDASGMFPIDSCTNNFDEKMLDMCDELLAEKGFTQKLCDIFPKSLCAGENAGRLTEEGALLLDKTGTLASGCVVCPPEGDAGTGMVATNSVRECTGNVSAGTSIFAMIVLEKALAKTHMEIDMVTTPTGKPVAMVHCNNCTSDLDAWVKLFAEVQALGGTKVDKAELYDRLYARALEGEDDCGGLLSYNYLSGEPITSTFEGRPLFVRTPNSRLSLGNFMRNQLFSIMATLKIGMEILTEQENVTITKLLGHGGLFKTKEVGQQLMASALGTPVYVMDSAGEGGAWGIALLAAFARENGGLSLEDYLDEKVFKNAVGSCKNPIKSDTDGFNRYMKTYKNALDVERSAIELIR